ncbi:carboxypeptidase-like regulatory domain-containing protein [Granulicella sp. WH15]|uniref:TonB-dependent receptor n=1 Tax=Granulicella sp. WH15 TaxID=2602070 RepID=UPI0013A5304C|nr:carboxypeptidase-like regulatory domain-containing protein [Granulicella sp. WH15]
MKRIAPLLLALACVSASAQQTRATLTGHVTDSTGALVPKALIIVTNTSTGAKTTVVSNDAGDYTVPFLVAGPYSVTATVAGFKTYVHRGLNLQVEQTVTENIVFSVGAVDQTVTVMGDAPLVDTATASTGQVLTAEEVQDLPSNGRSPLGFARDEYGAVSKGKHSQAQTRPFDNSAADDFSLGGGNSASNEILLNGVPNMQDSSRLAGYSPQLDSVDAVRVDEFSSDASTGDTSGGTVNITTKGGTNDYHGSISEYYAGSRPLTAKPYYTPAGVAASSNHFNQFGGTIGGPIRIPHLYNGRDKLFFFYSFEGYIGSLPLTLVTSVPTDAEKMGDFSALLAISPSYQLYNPYAVTATTSPKGGTTFSRAAIPGNKFSNAGLNINTVAANYFKYFPEPNYNGPSTKADGTNNFFSDEPTQNNYKSNAVRIDYNISQSNKIFGEIHRSTALTTQGNYFHNNASGTTGEVLLWGGSLDDVQNFSPTLNLNTRLGFSRSVNTSEPTSFGTDPTSLGFPEYIGSTSTLHAIPRLTFTENNNTSLIPSVSTAPGNVAYFDTIQFFASLNKTWGKHTIKIGPDIRLNKDSTLSPGNANGTYAFSSTANDFVTYGTTGSIQPFGNDFALLALGLPTSGSFDVNTKFQYNNWYAGMFIQDDWKVKSNFTISLGLRVEHETPITESGNRMTTGWDPTIVNIGSVAAAAAYAKSPSLLPVSQFVPTGGLIYATPSNRNAYHTAAAYLGPRVGFAYSPDWSHGKTSIRAGFGIFDNPFNDYYSSQTYGYSQTTSAIFTPDNYQSVATTLSDPFPTSNPIQQPVGSSLGVNTNLGNKIVFYAPNVKVAYSERSSFDIQQQFGKNWMLDVGYINNHQVHQSYSNSVNAGSGAVPVQYLSQSRYYDPVATAAYSPNVANPYKGTLTAGPAATTSLNTSSTIGQSALLWPNSEYSSVTEQLIPGASANYNALLIRLEKRMDNGLEFNVNYTYSRNLGAQSQLNPGGPLWYGETASDFPHSLHLTGIYQLPFGKGMRFLNQDSRLVDEFVGGWQISAIWSFDSGTPYSWGNVIYNGDWHDFKNNPHNPNGLAFNTSVFDTRTCTNPAAACNNTVGSAGYNPNVQPNAYNNRTFPLIGPLRADVTNNWDFSAMKNFHIYDRIQIQPRIDAFNAFNRVQFAAPNLSPTSTAFGQISGQQNTNRQLQGGVHIIF